MFKYSVVVLKLAMFVRVLPVFVKFPAFVGFDTVFIMIHVLCLCSLASLFRLLCALSLSGAWRGEGRRRGGREEGGGLIIFWGLILKV